MRMLIALSVFGALVAVLLLTHDENFEARVRVIGPEGRVLGSSGVDGVARIEDPDTGETAGYMTGSTNAGFLRFACNRRAVVLHFHSPGCRPLRLEPVGLEQEVSLTRGIAVDLTVTAPSSLPEAPYQVELEIDAVGVAGWLMHAMCVADETWFTSPHQVRARGIRLPASGNLRLWFPQPGSYDVSWVVMRRHEVREAGYTSVGGQGHGLGQRVTQRIVVEERPNQRFDFAIEAGDLAEVMAKVE